MKYNQTLIASLLSALCFAPVAQAQELPTAVSTSREMVVTANPLATAAGEKILKTGGTAADAMIAVQAVLGLVEPQSSGIGGGAFIVYYDAASGKTITIDAREKAPAAADQNRFINTDGFLDRWQSGLSVGVPGVPRMMEYMHDNYGKKNMRRLFVPAIKLAQKGFALTERTNAQLSRFIGFNDSCEDRLFFRDPTAFDYFFNDDCTAKAVGTIIKNKPYADTLKLFARRGDDAFYTGAIAQNIANAVQGDLNIPGDMTVQDLANYDIVVREPVCFDYRSYDVCGMGPPSSGGLAVGQILGIMEQSPLVDFTEPDLSPLDVDVVHLFTQAGRLAFADRNQYVADSDFVSVPVEGMLDKQYLASRAALLSDIDIGPAAPGEPPGAPMLSFPDSRAKNSGTSHVSIVDRFGNALSMTTTVESSFGNGVMVNGFLLNNQLTDFASNPIGSDGSLVANRVEANKRPRSSMAPTIVFKNGEVELVTGSPGGSRIIGYTAQSVMNHIDFDLDPQESINVPHYMNRNGRTDIEIPIPGVTLSYDAEALAQALIDKGHSMIDSETQVGIIAQTSGLSIIQVTGDGFVGGGDLRRDGTVGGQ